MPDEQSLEGWVPAIDSPETLAHVIEEAFAYRGDVTVERTDGTQLVGYLCNRGGSGSNAFAEIIPVDSPSRVRLAYSEIKAVRFTGKDTAAGQSWEAWQKRREANAKGGAQV